MNTAKLFKTILLLIISVNVLAENNSAVALFEPMSGYYICQDKQKTIAKLSEEKRAEQIIKGWSDLSRCKGEIQYRHHDDATKFIEYPVRGVHKAAL